VGCGTGRLLLDYLRTGLDVDGVDNSPDMLALCRAKAREMTIDVEDRLFQQPMESLSLPRRYATILVPSSSFQLLTAPQAADAALARFHEHLAPGGAIAMPFMCKLWPGRRTPPRMEWSDWLKLSEAKRAQDGAVLRRWIRTRYDHDQQLEHEENRYEVLVDGVVTRAELHHRSPAVRWYSQAQARALYEAAGFSGVTLTRDFTFEPASPEDTIFCVMGVKR
jgi:SAM-dependent methyltransferase